MPEKGANVSIERLDQIWFEWSAVSYRNEHPRLIKEYGELYQRYIEDVLKLGALEDSNLFEQIRAFTTDRSISEVQDSVSMQYPNLDDLEMELTTAWNYYLHYFPEKSVPKHLSFIGGFNTPAILTGEGVGIGLDMFLGAESVFYEYLQLPVYLRNRMTPNHIVPTVMKGWVQSEYPLNNSSSPTLLDVIIAEGKVLYTLDALLPFHHDSLKIDYSGQEIIWAQEHQKYVWAHFIDNELLFSTDGLEINKFTNDGPFTVDLVKESPPRMGHFIGWQIVRSFMNKQDSIDIPALMQMEPEKLLNESKYKP